MTTINSLPIKKLSQTATIPTKGSKEAAGYDLYADNNEQIIILPHCRALIPTNISMEIPYGFYGRLAPRSGLAYKNGIDVLAGVIDADYRGSIGVILFNTDKDKEFIVNKGDRIAQIIFEQCFNMMIKIDDMLENTERGAGGFGSTGK